MTKWLCNGFGYAIYLLLQKDNGSKVLIYILGFWWIFLGIALYASFGKIDNFLLNTSKGLLLVGLNYFFTKSGNK